MDKYKLSSQDSRELATLCPKSDPSQYRFNKDKIQKLMDQIYDIRQIFQ
jgi:hypothetical protein